MKTPKEVSKVLQEGDYKQDNRRRYKYRKEKQSVPATEISNIRLSEDCAIKSSRRRKKRVVAVASEEEDDDSPQSPEKQPEPAVKTRKQRKRKTKKVVDSSIEQPSRVSESLKKISLK